MEKFIAHLIAGILLIGILGISVAISLLAWKGVITLWGEIFG